MGMIIDAITCIEPFDLSLCLEYFGYAQHKPRSKGSIQAKVEV